MQSKLMPCCGEVPEIKYLISENPSKIPHYLIKCKKCHSGVQVNIRNFTEQSKQAAREHAIELWNRRNTNEHK